MPAELHHIDKMIYSGRVPWHGLGEKLENNITAIEAFEKCLDWKVIDSPIYLSDGTPIDTHKALLRSDTNDLLAIMGSDYQPIQNELTAKVADSLVGSESCCHTAGSLKAGKKIWFLMELGKDQLKDSDYVKYLMICNTHDGSSSFKVFFTTVRVVCNNTYNASIRGMRGNTSISVKHSKNAIINLKDAVDTMDRANSYFGRFIELAKVMQDTPYTDQQMKDLSEFLLPGNPQKNKKSKKVDTKLALTDILNETTKQTKAMDSLLQPQQNVSLLSSIVDQTKIQNGTFDYSQKEKVATRTKKQREKMVELFETGQGNDRVRGSAWAAFNAVTEYTDHHKVYRNTESSSAQENRMDSVVFGESSKIKERALAKILEQVQL